MRGRLGVEPTAAERAAVCAGDELVQADAVMDRGFTVPGSPESVFPWIAQLGKGRAGWYLPRSVERVIPARNRAIRRLDERWTEPVPGTVVPDYGGPRESMTVELFEPPHALVYLQQRGQMHISWALLLSPVPGGTRVHVRLRMGPVRRRRLLRTVGEAFDLLTIAGMAAGLRERVPSGR